MELSTRRERMNKRKMEAKCSTRYIRKQEAIYNGGRIGRTKPYKKTLKPKP